MDWVGIAPDNQSQHGKADQRRIAKARHLAGLKLRYHHCRIYRQYRGAEQPQVLGSGAPTRQPGPYAIFAPCNAARAGLRLCERCGFRRPRPVRGPEPDEEAGSPWPRERTGQGGSPIDCLHVRRY
jgi:hypothetical protein